MTLASKFDREQDATLLGLMRVVFAALLLHNALKLGSLTLNHAYFGDILHVPLWPESFVPNRGGYLALLALQAATALLALLGVLARPALFASALTALFLFGLDRLQYHNNRYVLILLAFLLSFAPCDRSFLPFRRAKSDAERLGPSWARWMIQVQVSLVYLASAGSKLVDADWRGGQVLSIRYQRGLAQAAARGIELPGWLHDLAPSPLFGELTSKAAIATELFLAVALWLPRTRAAGLWLGALFHFGIEAGARVEVFSYLMWGAFLSFCVPELGERKVLASDATALGRLVARALPRLDWLRRFELAGVPDARALTVVDRDGRRASGLGAIALLARGLPLLFPLWPLLRAAELIARRAPAAERAEAPCDS